MDEHHLHLPAHLNADGLTGDEHIALLIGELEAWSFWWGDARNMVMLVSEDD